MLARENRLTSSDAFRSAVRSGGRAGSRTVVIHVARTTDPEPTPAPPRVGFVVSKAVGGSVVRNLVKRRLRHLMREQLGRVPAGSVVVVRALPAAAAAPAPELRGDLERCLDRVLRRSPEPAEEDR